MKGEEKPREGNDPSCSGGNTSPPLDRRRWVCYSIFIMKIYGEGEQPDDAGGTPCMKEFHGKHIVS
jgi:hypothetical protein